MDQRKSAFARTLLTAGAAALGACVLQCSAPPQALAAPTAIELHSRPTGPSCVGRRQPMSLGLDWALFASPTELSRCPTRS